MNDSVFKVVVIIESILDISKFGKAYSGKTKFKKEPSVAHQDTDISTKVLNENEGVFNLTAMFECCYSLNCHQFLNLLIKHPSKPSQVL